MLAFPLTAVAQEARWEETAPAPGAFTQGESGYSPLLTLLNPTVGRARLGVADRVTWLPEEPVAGQPTHLDAVQQEFSVAFPLWQDRTHEWSAFATVRSAFFHTQAVLPDTRQTFPEALWQLRFGTVYRHQFANGWIGGGTLSVGSASDRPFASSRELLAGGSAFLRVPQGQRNAWLFSLAYSPTSELGIPLPGVAYVAQPSERLLAVIGLPLALRYRPWATLSLEASYIPLRTVHARAISRLVAPLRLFASFDWRDESYFLADRLHTKDRFFSYDKRATAGMQLPLGRHGALELAGGYVFDRFYFEGQGYSDRDHNRIDVGAGPVLSFQGQVRW